MNPISKLEEIMDTLTKNGYTYQLRHLDIENAIVQVRGIDKRTIDRWVQLLVMFNFIKPIGKNVYEINITKLKIGELLRNKPQTHIS